MRPLLVLTVAMLLAVPASAATPEPVAIPPEGTVVLLVAVSDGMTLDAVGQAVIPPGAVCGQ